MRRPIARSVELRLTSHDRVDHLPGQHYVVRLTAEDGYTAQRSYSVASAPGDPLVELFVERLDDGEVSGYLADVVEPGDELEVRGPIGGWFVWDGDDARRCWWPAGTGVVPFVAMLRHARGARPRGPAPHRRLRRTLAELPYADELADAGALIVLTREAARHPPGRPADRGRPRAALGAGATAYVCGSAGSRRRQPAAGGWGCPPTAIRVERFGPSG